MITIRFCNYAVRPLTIPAIVAFILLPLLATKSGLADGFPPPPPLSPVNVQAVAGNRDVTISWDASDGTSYNIYRGPATGDESTTPIATGITKTSYTNTGLTNGVTYYYTVSTVNSGGTSSWSMEVSGTPEPSIPAAPTGLTAKAGNQLVELSWTGNASAAEYGVYRGATSGGESDIPRATVKATTYTDTGLINGLTYYYVVRSVNGGGTSAESNQVTATPKLPVPAAPGAITAKGANEQITLAWSASAAATTYNVYRGTTSGGESAAAVASVSATEYVDMGLVNGKTYYYVVKAANAAGTSTASAQVSAKPILEVPLPPAGLVAAAGNAQVSLTWDASLSATAYDVYRGTASGGESATAIATVDATEYVSTGLTNGRTYYFVVKAVNAAGRSSASKEASATPRLAAPIPPTGLVAVGGNEKVTLTWTASISATAYEVCRGATSGGESAKPVATVSTVIYVDTGLTNGKTYFYTLKAVNAAGTSKNSAQASAEPKLAIPLAPVGLTAKGATGSVTLTWSASVSATSYKILRGTSSLGESSTPIATVDATAYKDTTVTNGKTYFYFVRAANALGVSKNSNQASATP